MAQVADSKIEIKDCRAAVAAVVESVTFHKAVRLRQLLSYICDRELAGRGAELREHEIGTHVFGRDVHYDPSEDSIVRASVRQLRSKLLEYYSAEGSGDPVEIQIPKGGYVPVFVHRDLPEGPQSSLESPLPSDAASTGERNWWRWIALVCVVSGLAVASFVLGARSNGSSSAGIPATAAGIPGKGSLMEHFLAASDGTVEFVPSDSMINLLRPYSGRPVSLENYRSKDYFEPAGLPASADKTFWSAMTSRELMNIGDASIVLRTAQEHPYQAHRISFRQARDLRMRDLKAGNFVFLGSVAANPWISVFDSVLNFQRLPAANQERAGWRNHSPRPGEKAVYTDGNEAIGDNRRMSYAHLALLPNLAHSGKILIIAGSLMPDTEATGEFVLSPNSGKILAAAMGINRLSDAKYFEVMLETRLNGPSATVSKVVAWREISTEISRNSLPDTAPAAEGN